jgi:Bacterial Ig domain
MNGYEGLNMNKRLQKSKILVGTTLLAATLLSGCGDSDSFVFTNSGTTTLAPTPPVPAPPVAVNDPFSALGNATVTYSAANGVLANDTVNGADISAFEVTASEGGAITLNADGSFSYTPVFGFVGVETFNYTLTNADGASTATATMTSTGQGWFVNNQAGTTGDGSQATPFDTLLEAVAASGNGDTIFVARGDGGSTGLSDDITLPQGVNLIGEGQGLILAQTVVPQGQAPVIDASVTVLGDNTISGFVFENPADAIMGDGFANLTVTNNEFRDGTDESQIDIENVLGSITIADNIFLQDQDIQSINLTTEGNCNLILDQNTFQLFSPTATGDNSLRLVINDGADATVQITSNTVTGSTTTSDDLSGFQIEQEGASQATLTISGNMFSSVGYAISLTTRNTSDLVASVTGNVCDLASRDSMDFSVNQFSQATLVLENNTVTNSGEDGLDFSLQQDSDSTIAVRNNTITGATEDAVRFGTTANANVCADITTNTFDSDLRFIVGTNVTFEVEQFGNAMGDLLLSLNTFTGGAGILLVGLNPVTSVADGACLIP